MSRAFQRTINPEASRFSLKTHLQGMILRPTGAAERVQALIFVNDSISSFIAFHHLAASGPEISSSNDMGSFGSAVVQRRAWCLVRSLVPRMLAEVMDESIFCGATLETEVVLGRVDDKGRTWAGDGGADVDAE